MIKPSPFGEVRSTITSHIPSLIVGVVRAIDLNLSSFPLLAENYTTRTLATYTAVIADVCAHKWDRLRVIILIVVSVDFPLCLRNAKHLHAEGRRVRPR